MPAVLPSAPQLLQLLITMSQRLITWQHSTSNFHIEGKWNYRRMSNLMTHLSIIGEEEFIFSI